MRSFFLLFLLFFSFKIQGQKIIDNSEIKKVSVFSQGAEISRSFSLQLNQGKTEMIVTGLSSSIDPASLNISSIPFVKIISVSSRIDFSKEWNQTEELNIINDSLEKINRKIEYKELQHNALEEEKKSLLANSVRIGTIQGLSVGELDNALIYTRKKLEEINNLLLKRDDEKQQLSKKLQKLITRQKNVLKADSAASAYIYILAESSIQQKVTFTLNYYVKSCGWSPIYSVFYKNIQEPLKLEYKANILNNSGEKWNSSKISLHAGNPSRSLTAPILETWVLSYHQKKRTGKNYGYYESGNEGSLSKKQIKKGATEEQEIELEEGEMIFNIEGEHTIPSSTREYLADIKQTVLEASYLYQSVPKIDAKAYLIARIKDWEGLKLIEGEVNVYQNGTYTGKTYLDPLAAGDSLELSLGPDPAIQISRVKKKDFSTRKLIGLQLVENFTYEIDVRNLNSKPVQIEIFDQIPIAQQEEIQISLEESDGASYMKENGKLTWKLDIPASMISKIRLGYSVKFPRDKVVIIKRTGRVVSPRFL